MLLLLLLLMMMMDGYDRGAKRRFYVFKFEFF